MIFVSFKLLKFVAEKSSIIFFYLFIASHCGRFKLVVVLSTGQWSIPPVNVRLEHSLVMSFMPFLTTGPQAVHGGLGLQVDRSYPRQDHWDTFKGNVVYLGMFQSVLASLFFSFFLLASSSCFCINMRP